MATKNEPALKDYDVNGIKVTLPEDVFDDFELFEALGNAEENPFKMPHFLRELLGKEQHKEVMDKLRNKSGKVTATRAVEFIKDLMAAVAPK